MNKARDTCRDAWLLFATSVGCMSHYVTPPSHLLQSVIDSVSGGLKRTLWKGFFDCGKITASLSLAQQTTKKEECQQDTKKQTVNENLLNVTHILKHGTETDLDLTWSKVWFYLRVTAKLKRRLNYNRRPNHFACPIHTTLADEATGMTLLSSWICCSTLTCNCLSVCQWIYLPSPVKPFSLMWCLIMLWGVICEKWKWLIWQTGRFRSL